MGVEKNVTIYTSKSSGQYIYHYLYLGKGRLSLKKFTAEGHEGGLFYWGPWVMSERPWRRASLFMETQMGKLERTRLLGTLRDS